LIGSPLVDRISRPTMANKKNSAQPKASAYQEFLAQHEQILRHKWILSEESGNDIGFEHALVDWIHHHRDDWRKSRKT